MVIDLEQHQLEQGKDLNPLELPSTKGYESDDLKKNKARLEESNVAVQEPRVRGLSIRFGSSLVVQSVIYDRKLSSVKHMRDQHVSQPSKEVVKKI